MHAMGLVIYFHATMGDHGAPFVRDPDNSSLISPSFLLGKSILSSRLDPPPGSLLYVILNFIFLRDENFAFNQFSYKHNRQQIRT